MTIPIFVEGDVDKSVLKNYAKIMEYPLDLEFLGGEGKDKILEGIKSLIPGTRGLIVAAQDIDNSSISQLETSYINSLQFSRGNVTRIDECTFNVDDNIVILIPSGLPSESVLKAFGLSQYMIEDYLLKILTSDDNVVNSLSHGRIKNSKDLTSILKAIIKILNRKNISFVSSKSLIDVTKGIFCYSASPANFAESILIKGDKSIVVKTMGSLDKYFQSIITRRSMV